MWTNVACVFYGLSVGQAVTSENEIWLVFVGLAVLAVVASGLLDRADLERRERLSAPLQERKGPAHSP